MASSFLAFNLRAVFSLLGGFAVNVHGNDLISHMEHFDPDPMVTHRDFR